MTWMRTSDGKWEWVRRTELQPWLREFLSFLQDDRASVVCSKSCRQTTIKRIEKEIKRAVKDEQDMASLEWLITIRHYDTSDLSPRAKKVILAALDGGAEVTMPVEKLNGIGGCGEKTFNEIAKACGSDIRCKQYNYFRISEAQKVPQ